MRGHRWAGLAVAAALVAGIGLGAPAAQAQEPTRRAPHPHTTAKFGFSRVPLDKQSGRVVIAVRAANNRQPVSVSWGDGTRWATRVSRCSPAWAARHPRRCTLHLRHSYVRPGRFTVVVTAGRRVLAKRHVTILPPSTPPAPAPAPTPAPTATPTPTPTATPTPTPTATPTPTPTPTPTAAQGSSTSWGLITGKASFTTCRPVYWILDRTGEPADRSTMHDEIAGALAVLSRETGIPYIETAQPAQANLKFWYEDHGPDGYSGWGGFQGMNNGHVILNSAQEWTKNDWAGLGVVTKAVDLNGQQGYMRMPGRGWLIIHETMHSLGFAHVDDRTQVMNPVMYTTTFGAGDLQGLHTVYLNQPCWT